MEKESSGRQWPEDSFIYVEGDGDGVEREGLPLEDYLTADLRTLFS